MATQSTKQASAQTIPLDNILNTAEASHNGGGVGVDTDDIESISSQESSVQSYDGGDVGEAQPHDTYGLYTRGSEDEENSADIYRTLTHDLHRSTSHQIDESKRRYNEKQASQELFVGQMAKFLVCLVAMAVGGILLFFVAEQLHVGNPMLPDVNKYRVLYVFGDLLSKYTAASEYESEIAGHALAGVFLGLLASFFNLVLSSVLPSPAPTPKKREPEDTNVITQAEQEFQDEQEPEDSSIAGQAARFSQSIMDTNLIRSIVAAVGLAYCFKKFEWASRLQVSELWALANVLIWAVLDSSLIGFLTSAIVSISTVVLSVLVSGTYDLDSFKDPDTAADLLWIGSFIFLGQIIFGKISRILFA